MSKHYEAYMRLQEVVKTIGLDDPDFDEIAENETEYTAFLEWALKKYAFYKQMAAANKEMIDTYKKRVDSYTKQQEYFKNYIENVLVEVDLDKFKSAYGSVSIGMNAPKPIVLDESKVPDEYFNKVLSKSAINDAVKAGKSIEGVAMDNGSKRITIRVK